MIKHYFNIILLPPLFLDIVVEKQYILLQNGKEFSLVPVIKHSLEKNRKKWILFFQMISSPLLMQS